jgi:hypothetical protein
VRINFTTPIQTVKGHWRGEGTAEIVNADEIGVAPELHLICPTYDWNDKIQVEESQVESWEVPWGDVQIPDDPRFAGQRVQLKMDIQVVYPKLVTDHGLARKTFTNTDADMSRTVTLDLANDRRAGETYLTCLWVGILVGGGLVVVTSLGVTVWTKSMRRKALPTETWLIDQEDVSALPGEKSILPEKPPNHLRKRGSEGFSSGDKI